MWDSVLELIISNGLWATLFIGLMVYILRDGKAREDKYQKVISELSSSLFIVSEIKKEVKEIKNKMHSILDKEKQKK